MEKVNSPGKLEFPKLDWFERYKRMYGAYDTCMQTVFYHELERSGLDAALDLMIKIHQSVSAAMGKKLCAKLQFEPDVKGAIQLMWTYSCEVWGFGMTDTVSVNIESPKRAVFINHLCHYWETWLKETRAMRCDKNCIHEYTSLVKALNPEYRVSMPKAFPRGDDCCEFVVEL